MTVNFKLCDTFPVYLTTRNVTLSLKLRGIIPFYFSDEEGMMVVQVGIFIVEWKHGK